MTKKGTNTSDLLHRPCLTSDNILEQQAKDCAALERMRKEQIMKALLAVPEETMTIAQAKPPTRRLNLYDTDEDEEGEEEEEEEGSKARANDSDGNKMKRAKTKSGGGQDKDTTAGEKPAVKYGLFVLLVCFFLISSRFFIVLLFPQTIE